MTPEHVIRVYYASKTIGGFKGREGMNPVCHSCDKHLGKSGGASSREDIPPNAVPLVFVAQAASDQVDSALELIDVARMSTTQRLRERITGKPLPRIEIGSDYITGDPSVEEVIELFHQMFPTLAP